MPEKLLNKFEKLNSTKTLKSLIKKYSDGTQLKYIPSLAGSYRSMLVKTIFDKESRVIVLCESVQEVNETKVELSLIGLSDKIISVTELAPEELQEKLTNISKKKNYILISTYDILTVGLPSKESIEKNTTILETGGEMGYDEVLEYLNLIDYDRDKFVDTQGMYAVRGSIIDFWSYSENHPCRLEFDGDFLESIRYFDAETQRSSGTTETITIASTIEDSGDFDSDIFDYIKEPLIFANNLELSSLFKDEKSEDYDEDDENDFDEELKQELFEGESPTHEEEEKLSLNRIKTIDDLWGKQAHWIIEEEIKNKSDLELDIHESPVINANYELLAKNLINHSEEGYKIFITAENELHAKRLRDLLTELKEELADLFESNQMIVSVLPIKKGFIAKKDKVVVYTDYQLFNKPYRTKLSSKQKFKKKRGKDFGNIKKGDFVVHENFGIGRYEGLETIKIGMVKQESIKLIYAEGDTVYVNLNYLALVKKFSDKENSTPSLSKLGSNEWKNAKKKVKKKIQDAARDLIKLYAQRKASEGFAYNPDTIWQKELEASFFYEDTPDQAKVTEEVKVDMESENPMDRLVCGDVGFGKTEVAVRAAFKAVNDGKQVALLVPTTILAEQHYYTFRDRLTQFPVKVSVMSRFRTKAQQNETLKGITDGKVDVVIGTHRLLSKDIKFKDLGLLMIDEEQRFGVMAKEKLRRIRANVDTLTLTATPIPRTLNLSLLGARDLSIIATPPPNRQPIYTKVDVFDIHKIREWILDEVKREGQIYFVHDRVQSINKIVSYLNRHIPEINIAVAHGQMKPAELEKVIYNFMNKKYHMLVSTKIIESGIDIPNVNTIIVNRADRFGLAELHQLRGRVGRSDKKAFAHFIVPSMKTITKKAVRRLQAIEEHAEIGEGFNLSMRDLEIRGTGNLLGTEQSGAIDTVGFDMYVKMLDEAVEELKQNEFKDIFKDLPAAKDRTEPTIDTYFEIGIPKDYMPEQADRLSFYTALFSMKNVEESKEIKEEIEDRFGKLPDKVERLVQIAILRYYASYALFERIVVKKDEVSFILPKGEKESFYKEKFTVLMQFIMENYSKDVRFVQGKESMKFVKPNRYLNPEDTIEAVVNFTKVIKNLMTDEKRMVSTQNKSE